MPENFENKSEGKNQEEQEQKEAIIHKTEEKSESGKKLNRRDFLKGAAIGFAGAILNSAKQENIFADEDSDEDSIEILNEFTRIGALNIKGWIEERGEPLPTGVTKCLIQFEKQLKQRTTRKLSKDDLAEILSDLDNLSLHVNAGTIHDKKTKYFTDALKKKPSKELVADLTRWATNRDAHLRVKEDIVSPRYKEVVINHLLGKDKAGATNIIKNLILKNIREAYQKEKANNHIAYLRERLHYYDFFVPKKNDVGDLELWTVMVKNLKREEKYWDKILSEIEKNY